MWKLRATRPVNVEDPRNDTVPPGWGTKQIWGQRVEMLGHSPQVEHGDLPVLIVAFRSAGLLEKCLDSVKRHHPDQDVLIWDNSGSDGNEVQELAGRYPYFTWYFSHRNIGFAAAVNLLANMVPGRDFLLLNPDAELIAPLERTVAALREPKVAAAGPMQFVADSPGARTRRLAISRPTEMAWDNCIRRLTLLNVLGVAAGLGKHLRGSPLSRSYRSAPTEVDGYIAGFCVAIRREAWDELGGFDEEFFLYSEDSEWPRRAANAGWKIRLAHEVAVRHLGQGTVTGDKALSRRSLDLNYSSLALETEYIYSVRSAEFVLVWHYVFDSIKRHIRGETSVSRPGADFGPCPHVVDTGFVVRRLRAA